MGSVITINQQDAIFTSRGLAGVLGEGIADALENVNPGLLDQLKHQLRNADSDMLSFAHLKPNEFNDVVLSVLAHADRLVVDHVAPDALNPLFFDRYCELVLDFENRVLRDPRLREVKELALLRRGRGSRRSGSHSPSDEEVAVAFTRFVAGFGERKRLRMLTAMACARVRPTAFKIAVERLSREDPSNCVRNFARGVLKGRWWFRLRHLSDVTTAWRLVGAVVLMAFGVWGAFILPPGSVLWWMCAAMVVAPPVWRLCGKV